MSAMIGSAAFPKVAFMRPPIPAPSREARCSVDLPMIPARGMMAAQAKPKTRSGLHESQSATTARGTNPRRSWSAFSGARSDRTPEAGRADPDRVVMGAHDTPYRCWSGLGYSRWMTVSGLWGWAARYGLATLALIALLTLGFIALPTVPGAGAQPAAPPQTQPPSPGATFTGPVYRDSITVVVGPEYAKPGMHEFFFGDNYRTLWDTAVRLPVLDLNATAGGLTPVRRLGGLQTRVLALRGADGRSYTFRGLEKEVSGLIEEDLQGTVVEDLLRDQMSAQHPAAELIASEITRGAGIHTQDWTLVALPNDPALGSFQEEFAGAIGYFAEFPTGPSADRPGTFGLVDVIDFREMYK